MKEEKEKVASGKLKLFLVAKAAQEWMSHHEDQNTTVDVGFCPFDNTICVIEKVQANPHVST
jgi:hypothetical protein